MSYERKEGEIAQLRLGLKEAHSRFRLRQMTKAMPFVEPNGFLPCPHLKNLDT